MGFVLDIVRSFLRAIFWSLAILVVLAGLAAAGGVAVLYYYGRGLPDYTQLAVYEPPTVTRVHAGDGRLIAEYALEKRTFVPIEAMPKRVIKAFLSAEDKNFYEHAGIDIPGIISAVFQNLAHIGSNKRPRGASTVTQQVAKNFLLTNEISLERKIKEAILAFRIERAFTKDRILELYLNEIYLGFGSYGVAAASLNYFNKSLGELTVAEAAYLAALPKAPNNYHPVREHEAAVGRRNWVIDRMMEDGVIGFQEARDAKASPLTIRSAAGADSAQAEYFVEEVRRTLMEKYGYKGLYEGGLSVRTSLDSRLQGIADRTLRTGLVDYDRRYGYRGPLYHLENMESWQAQLSQLARPSGLLEWTMAVVISLDEKSAALGFADGTKGTLPFAEMRWARAQLKNRKLGPALVRPADALAVGDVVAVEEVYEVPASGKQAKPVPYPENTYALQQIPEIGGAVIALDPHTGRVLAMSGGYSHDMSEFNRATQAFRQPGSAFKPFVYLAALEEGYTPSTLILDAPFVIDQGPGLGKWKPANYTKEFYGPSPMRIGVEKSRNLMTVRLAQTIGIEKVAEYVLKFDVMSKMEPQLSMALGSGETTLMRLVTAYAMLVNGGKKIEPSLIDRVQDRHGRNVSIHDQRPCSDCRRIVWQGSLSTPVIPDTRAQIVDAGSAYQVVSMLQGVVERGTAQRVRSVGKPLAGKTGTTNKSFDTWFIGFSPDLVVGVFAGFDQPATLGRETGSSVAAPVFRDFMVEALAGKPGTPFRVPAGIRLVRVNPATGLPAGKDDKNVILEAFKPGTEPTGRGTVLEGSSLTPPSESGVSGPGGLY